MIPSLSSASTSPTRRYSQDSHELPSVKPNKYKLIFGQQERLGSWGYTPQDRIKAQGQHLKELQESLSANLKHSYFFTLGTQKNDRHFRDLYAQFFSQIHGNDSLVDGASKDLVRKSGRYVDLHFGGLEDRLNYPTQELLEELNSLAHEKQGLQQDLLNLLKKNYRKLKPNLKLHDWETTHADGGNVDANYFLTYLLQKGMLGLKPSFHQNLRDICIKLLEIAWLENDIDQLKLFILDPTSPMKTPSPSKNSSPLNIKKLSSYKSETPQGFEFSGQYYEIRTTVGDGACALHALLGQEVLGEFEFFGPGEDVQQEVKPLFLQKLRNFKDKSFLLNILKGHLHAQNDPSSNLLFSNQQGTLLKHEYHEIKANFQPRVEELNLKEAKLWIQQLILPQFKEKILQEARESTQNTGKSDPQIIDEIRSEPVLILNAINANRDSFSQELSAKKKQQLAQIKADYLKALDDREKAEKAYLLQKVYPHYEAIFQTPEFFLNTEELELAAKVFEKKTQVVKHSDSGEIEAATAVLNPELDSDLILIYHQGAHFSRCEPCSESRLNSYLIRNTYEKALNGADQAKKASEKFWGSLKEESSKVAVSAMYAAGTKNPIPLGVQVAKSGVNTFGHYLDPNNESTVMQMAQLIANSGVAKYVGGNPKHIAQGLVVDAVNVYTAPKPSTKEESNLRGIGLACVKGVLTFDPVKFSENFLGQVIADGSREFVPQEKQSDGMGMRLLRSAVTSPDMHGVLVDSIIKDLPKNTPKEDTGQRVEVDPDSESQFPRQIITEVETEQLVTEVEIEQQPKEPVMQDPEAFLRLQKQLGQEVIKLFSLEQTAIEDKNQYNKDRKDKQEYKDKKDDSKTPYGVIKYGLKTKSAKETCDKSKPKMEKSAKAVTVQENFISDIKRDMAIASRPKQITAPDLSLHKVFETTTKKHHHVYIVDSRGDKHSLGKYASPDDARLIVSSFSREETNSANYKAKCFEIQQAMLDRGISIENIPTIPVFETPSTNGNNADKNYKAIQQTGIANRGDFQAFVNSAEQLIRGKVETQGLSKTEINQIAKQLVPNIKEIKHPSVIDKIVQAPGKAYDGTCKFLHKINFSTVEGGVNIVTFASGGSDQNKGAPTLFHINTNQKSPPQSSYSDTQHQIMLEKSQLSQIEQRDRQSSSRGQWENVEAEQAQQMFDRNMAYKSSPINTPSQPLDFGPGVANNVQIPPTDWSNQGRNEIAPYQSPQRTIPIQMAGVMPFILTKVVPEQTQRKVETWVKGFIQQWKDDPIKARKDMDLCLILGAKNVIVVAIQANENPSLKTRPNLFGLKEASDKFDNWFAGKANIDLTSPNAQIAMFVGEIAMPLPMVGAFKHCTKVGQEGIAFIKQAKKLMRPPPLLDRALAFPQGFSKEVRAIEAFQNPIYRSGFVHNKTVEQARKAVNLPAFKKMQLDIDHAVSGHLIDGYRAMCKGSKKSLFPEGTSQQQLEKIIEHAYKNCKRVRTQPGHNYKILVRGKYEGMEVDMWINTRDKVIETAYPRSRR